jgi:hypothetical protein
VMSRRFRATRSMASTNRKFEVPGSALGTFAPSALRKRRGPFVARLRRAEVPEQNLAGTQSRAARRTFEKIMGRTSGTRKSG